MTARPTSTGSPSAAGGAVVLAKVAPRWSVGGYAEAGLVGIPNVMIGRDGRARVMDFGLARGAEMSSGTGDSDAGEDAATDLRLTRTGTMLGTPLYMAPEQHAGLPADARSDVFAFSVALHQALYGERPFAGDTLAVLVVNAQRGAVRPPPPGSRVPAWLRRIVLRGLQADPEAARPADDEAVAVAVDGDGNVVAVGTLSIIDAFDNIDP